MEAFWKKSFWTLGCPDFRGCTPPGQNMGFEMGGQTAGKRGTWFVVPLVRTPFARSSHAHVLTLTPRTTRERPVVICANQLRMDGYRRGKVQSDALSLAFHSDGKNYPARITDTAAAYDGNIKYCNGIH